MLRLVLVAATLTGLPAEGTPPHPSQGGYARVVSVEIGHGAGVGDLGMLHAEAGLERPAIGPRSFAVDRLGDTYVCDTANRRIQVFQSSGDFVHSIALPAGTVPADIVVDEEGNLYVLDDVQGTLSTLHASGDLLGVVSLDTSRWRSRGPMHWVGDTIFMMTPDQRDVPIAEVRQGVAEAVSATDGTPGPRGILGPSGRRYNVTLPLKGRSHVRILDESGELTEESILELEGLVSIRFLGEDSSGRFYLQTEVFEPPKSVHLAVHRFSPEGQELDRIPIPRNDYAAWSVKLVEVSQAGHVHQLVATRESSYLNVFAPGAGQGR